MRSTSEQPTGPAGPVRRLIILVVAAVAVAAGGCGADTDQVATPPPEEPIRYQATVVAEYRHDPASYTQGLEFIDGLLLESTGRRGRSTIRLVDPSSGLPDLTLDLDPSLYGEGTTVVGDELIQLTYTSGVALVRSLDDLAVRREFSYEGEGWGLCLLDDRLVMSNGSSRLTFRDPATFEAIDSVGVVGPAGEVDQLNELECVDGQVWANIYQTNRIVRIDPATGAVTGEADLTELVPPGFEASDELVLNGIAHEPSTGRYWVTGKEWPVMYELELAPLPDSP
ncbi:MAG: glutaminyl-peptide cyclotransferase [Actinomycetota bacterium]